MNSMNSSILLMKEEKNRLFLLIVLASLAADQYTKYLVSSNMVENQTISFISGIFDITYVRNTGAAFGIFAGKQLFLSIVTGIMLLALSVYAISQRKKISKLETVSIALIVGGGLGNLITRTIYSYVIDFFNFYFWPVFNVADIAICIGCALLVITVLIVEPRKQKSLESENM